MNELIEIDNLDGFRIQKYAYLHSEEDEDVIFNTERKNVTFEPETTLSMFLARNYFTPEGAPDEICFLYIYFPPGAAANSFDFYDNQEPGYVIAAWSEYRSQAIVGTSLGLNQWAKERLTARDFSCTPNDLSPKKLATDGNGDLIDLPGINFQFSRYGYSKVKL